MSPLTPIADLVERLWKERNYDEAQFPAVAVHALTEIPPHELVSPWDVHKWALMATSLPFQADLGAEFGDPPLSTNVSGRGFRIELLNWTRGVPGVHQHGFSGAFHVLWGKSIHTEWKFEFWKRICMYLQLGRVSLKNAEILHRGDTRPILAGDAFYHATYHLEQSATVVVRTVSERDQQPQLSLLPWSIAHSPLDKIATLERQKQLWRMLLRTDQRGRFMELMRHVLSTTDAYAAFEFLRDTYNAVQDQDDRELLLLTARQKHPELIDALQPVLERELIGSRIIDLHRSAENADLKYFLALMRNIPERDFVLKLIKDRYPHPDPIALVMKWMREIAQDRSVGFELDEPRLTLFHCLLTEPSIEAAEAAYWQRPAIAAGPQTPAELHELTNVISNFWLVQSLLTHLHSASITELRTDHEPPALEASAA